MLMANVYIVTSGNDSGANTLRQAIIDANNNTGHDSIMITNSVHLITLTTEAQSNLLLNSIQDSLTLFGNDTVVEAQIQGRIALIIEYTLIIDLTFKNALYQGVGGAVWIGENGKMINCKFINNIIFDGPNFSFGGALHHQTGELDLINCEFINNSSPNEGGAINTRQGVLNLHDCTFTNNTAGTRGQSIHQNFGGSGNPSTINIFSCTFNSNVNKPDIHFNDGTVVFHSGYEINVGNKVWVNTF